MKNLKDDIASGFLVFLIALPLCMGISLASGYPALAGIITAVIGGMLTGLLGGSPLTIKGPAAGLIVIVFGAVQELQDPGDPLSGYHRALAVGGVAGLLQVVLGYLRLGKLATMMPTSVIHGMLAAIGIIIISKQIHLALGATPTSKAPADLLLEIPQSFINLNPEIALLGLIAFLFMFAQPMIQKFLKRRIPSAILVLVVTMMLGYFVFDLDHEHTYSILNHPYKLDSHYLVQIPGPLNTAITFPDWSHLFSAASIKYILIFMLVGSIESLLTVTAIDSIDPQHRRSNLNRDLIATGCANTIASLLGGLPMISEIVRSKANVDSGAKSFWSNFIHGAFLLLFTLTALPLLREIPSAALAGILVFVGTRLASPAEFKHMWKVGPEQFFFFALTCFLTVTVDLLVGVGSGLAAAILFFAFQSRSFSALGKLRISKREMGDRLVLHVQSAALFSNFASLEKELGEAEHSKLFKTIEVNFNEAKVVEHTFLEHLKEFARELDGIELLQSGLSEHKPFSSHQLATRVKRVA